MAGGFFQQYTIVGCRLTITRHLHLAHDTHSNREGWGQQGGREGRNKTPKVVLQGVNGLVKKMTSSISKYGYSLLGFGPKYDCCEYFRLKYLIVWVSKMGTACYNRR
jgi:hypothetical protein